jgi:type IV secretory pathway TraG/TraD family ATPase VirD4
MVDLNLMVRCTKSPDAIAELIKQVPIDLDRIRMRLEEAYAFLSTSDSFKSLQGLRVQLESIIFSDFGERVLLSSDAIDLFDAVRSGKIVFMFLDTRRFGETARAVGRFIIQDHKAVSARIDSEIKAADRKPFTVIIDEFADLAQEDFIGFLDRARSSRIGIVVAHQEISDLDIISPQFCGRLMGNTATLFAFLQKRPESAELICGIAGTRRVKEVTHQFDSKMLFRIPTGMQSQKEVDEFIIHPNVVKSLGVGECVVVSKYPRQSSKLLKIAQPLVGQRSGCNRAR